MNVFTLSPSGPKPPGFLGSYSVTVRGFSGAAPASGFILASLRWAPTSGQILALTRVSLQAINSTAGNADTAHIGLVGARAFTAADSGGQAVTLTGNELKKRSSYPSTLVTDLRYSIGTGLTSGTRVLDQHPFFGINGENALASAGLAQGRLWDMREDPIVLVSGEGLELQELVTLGAAVHRFVLGLEWSEFKRGSLV